MKIEMIDDDRFVVYYSFILDDILEYDIEDIKVFIQLLVVRLKNKYNLDIEGYYHLDVYVNKILILEFYKIDEYSKKVDLNIVIHLDSTILVEFDDYFINSKKKYFYKDKYYLKIEDIDFLKYIEFIRFVYDKEATNILNNAKIVWY